MGFEEIPSVRSTLRMVEDIEKNYWHRADEDQKAELKAAKAELEKLIKNAQLYNDLFAAKGWVVYDSLDPTHQAQAVAAYDRDGMEEAERVILSYYSPDKVRGHRPFLRRSNAGRRRMELLDLAYDDYDESRYHAVILNLVTLIDGIVNDTVGRGFHSETADLDCWGSITNVDGALEQVRDIYCRARNKTRTEPIDMPYRHGILHGRDLGYANSTVAAKCWCFLFVVSDWAANKETENTRKAKREPESVAEVVTQNEDIRAKHYPSISASLSFKDSHAEKAYIDSINEDPSTAAIHSPEERLLEFLEYWKEGNYGRMSPYFCKSVSKAPGTVRQEFGNRRLSSYRIVEVHNRAAAVANVGVELVYESEAKEYKTFIFWYEDEGGQSTPRNLPAPNCEWRILDIQEDLWIDGQPASVAKAKRKRYL